MSAVKFHQFSSADPVSDPVTIYDGRPARDHVLTDMICLPQFDCLYHKDGSRAPATCIRRGSNLNIESIGPEHVELPDDIRRHERPLIYLGTLAWNFWGHFLSEGLSRVWCLRHCRELDDLQGIFFTRAGDLPWQPHVSAFLRYSDLDAQKLMHCETPLLLSEVHIPRPSMVNRNHAFSDHPESHAIVAQRICGNRPSERSDQPVYISRRQLPELHRKIVTEDRLEIALVRAGVRVVCPEHMAFEDQINLFLSHRIFIGCIGSGFHSLLFAARDGTSKTIVLCDPKINANYRIIDELQQIDADYINCLSVDPTSRKIDPDRILDLDVALHQLRRIGIL
jgi:capsular polysaccharide biosynthesis protein